MSSALRDVLEQHAHDVDDVAAGDRLAQIHGRVTTVKRRRRVGGSVLAAVVVAALAVGLTVFTGDQRDQRPEPARPTMEGYAPQGEYAASPQGVPVAKAYVDVPATQFRLVFSCPLAANGRATLRIQPEQKGTGLPPETFWEGPCSSEPTTLDLDGPGLELPSGATYPPNTFASITMNQVPAEGEQLDQNETKVRLQVYEKVGARDLRVAGIEVDQTFKEMDGKTYELSRVVESKPGARELSIDVTEEDAYVRAAVGYRAEAEITGPGVGPISTDQRVMLLVHQLDFDNPNALNLAGAGTYRIKVTDGRTPDGVLGFAIYRPVP